MDNLTMSEDSNDLPELKRTRQDTRVYTSTKRQRLRKQRLSTRETTRHDLKDDKIQAIICDSGGYTIKFGKSTDTEPKIIPNCIMKAKSERKRLFIGNQIDECRDCSGLFFLLPCEKGYITKWDVQKPIWDYVFNKNVLPLNELPLIMTQPLMNFKTIQECTDEIFFEEYEVNSMIRVNPTDLAMLKYQQDIGTETPCLIVDSGFSFTHAVPYIDGKKYFKGTKRLNVGGKLLTNHLKDIISYRQYHVMEETYVINQVKEDTCYVAEDFKNDIKIAGSSTNKNSIVRNYVLPDFNNIRRGYIQIPDQVDEVAENCQILRLNNERFTVPEILFHPSDIGIKSMGIAEMIVKSIQSCPVSYQKKLANNIVIIGGTTKFPGFKNRLYSEVRSLLSDSWEVNMFQPTDPISYSWMGGKSLLEIPDFKSRLVTKEQYEEIGSVGTQLRFNDWATNVEDSVKPKREIQPISLIEHIKKYNVFGKADANEESNVQDPVNTDNGNDNNGNNTAANNSNEDDNKEPIKEENDLSKMINKNLKKTGIKSSPIIYSVKILSSDVKR